MSRKTLYNAVHKVTLSVGHSLPLERELHIVDMMMVLEAQEKGI